MKTTILFPCSPFNIKEVDDNFKSEYEICKLLGIDYFFFDHDSLVDDEKNKFFGLKGEPSMIVLRGWMLKPAQYERLINSLKYKDYGVYNTLDSYVQCHYLKNSYKYIEPYTAKTLFSDKFDKETLGKMFDQFDNGIILKDYVKSEKHVPGLFRIPKETTHEQLEDVVKRFIEARGKLFNEGIAFREFVELKKYDGEVNEWRVFVFNKKIATVEQNSNINIHTNKISKPPDILIQKLVSELNKASYFFTIDFAEKSDGTWMVVETGDGQVSGLAPNQNPIGLYNHFIF